ncbi:MAG TPA: glycosyltransferase family 1 protein [Humisphaera sp.]|jgi:glycosyltransferase involved in cell wall biosynthesis|nr:glycosyltransferase family 1 protein [Humisphaera sp.]
MNIAIDTNCILPGRVGGIENYTLGLIEALKRGDSPGSRLVLITRPENHELFAGYADDMTMVHCIDRPTHDGLPVGNWADLLARDPVAGRTAMEAFALQKSELLRRHGVELVHFPGNTINPLELKLPTVLNLHDLQHRHFPQYFSPQEIENRERWWAASAHRADALIAASNYVRDDLQAQLGIDRSKIFVTPDVFQSDFLREPHQVELDALRIRLSLPAKFFIYPAAIWPHKNHHRLIRAFIAANIPGSELILTGGGERAADLAKLIDGMGARHRIKMLGRVSTQDLIGLYHMATALIFPSEHEAWSIPIMEAMACGCPVASSNVTSLPEEIGDAGLLFSPDDTMEMCLTMKRLASDADLRTTLAAKGKVRVKQFGPETFLRTLKQAYEFAVRSHPNRKAA